MQSYFKSFLLSIILFSSLQGQASHVLGAEISFLTDTSNINHVKVFLKLYRDPSGVLIGNTQAVQVESGQSGSFNVTCLLDSVEYLQVSCSDSVEIYHYSSLSVNLTNLNPPYTFTWSSCCRPLGIDNIAQASSGTFVRAVMFIGLGYQPVQFYGPQILSYVTDSIVEVDFSSFSTTGDSAYTQLIAIKELTGSGANPSHITLDSAYTPQFPFDTTRVTNLNNYTGVLSVQNPPIGTFAMAVKTTTYNSSGVFLTRIYRDVTIFILPNNGHVVQPEGELSNPTAQNLINNSTNGIYDFGIYTYDTLKFDFKVKPMANPYNDSVFAKVALRGLWAENSQGGLCTTNSCARLISNSGSLFAADSLSVQFVFSPDTSVLGSQDSASQFFKLEYTMLDSCGVGVHKSEKIKVTVYKTQHKASSANYRICEKDSVKCVISSGSGAISWMPTTGVNSINNSTYYLSPIVSTLYTVYNLTDSTFIKVRVEVDTLITALPLSVVNDTLVMPSSYQQYNSWSYINGRFTYLYPNHTPVSAKGKYWVRLRENSKNCDSYSDTLFNIDPNVAVSSARCNGDITNASIGRFAFNFEPVHNNTILKNFRIMFEYNSLASTNGWNYRLKEVGGSVLKAGEMTLDIDMNFMMADSIDVNLLNTTEYELFFSPKTPGTISWLRFAPPGFPFVDENNLIQFNSGSTIAPVFNFVVPFIEMEVKQPNISIDEDVLKNVKVFPNPFNDEISVEVEDEGSYVLFDALGRKMLSGTFQENFSIETRTVSKGLYVLQLDAKDKTIALKLMK